MSESHNLSDSSLINHYSGNNDSEDILAQLENLDISEINENRNKSEDVLSNFESLTLRGDDGDVLNLNSLTANDLLTGEPAVASTSQSVVHEAKEDSTDLLF